MANPGKYYVAFFEISYRSLDEVKSKEPQSLAAHLARSRELYQQGKVLIGAYDLILAATALERESGLATFNKRHFANVKGLRVIEPK